MEKEESLIAFYKNKYAWLPELVADGLGHFSIFQLQPWEPGQRRSTPYRRRAFYKVMLVRGRSQVHYADKVIQIQKQALTFSDPLIPYKWEHLDEIRNGHYCIFDASFFTGFGHLNKYSVFQPQGEHVFELDDEAAEMVEGIFKRMEENFHSDYLHKYDLLRNQVFELIHFASQRQSNTVNNLYAKDASGRITVMFLELLERQFPLDEDHTSVKLKHPADFANQLNIHVNHLNKSLKKVTGKTTSQHLSERFLTEAKMLIRQSHLNVSEIAFALGFTEVTHFNAFFKKMTGVNPSKFKNEVSS